MAWIKRNLFFVIGGVLALGLLGAAGFYNFQSWRRNLAAVARLEEIYSELKELNSQKPSPGSDRINNITAAKEQEGQLRGWIRQAGSYFQPITPVPNPTSGIISDEGFAAALRRMIDQLQHEADSSSVILPPQYAFSFEAERKLVKFAPGGLEPLAVQLGEVKMISEILFASRVNSLDGVQRIRVSNDDTAGPQADYLNDQSVTNNLAVMTPYAVTFRSFTPEIAEVLAGFASSPHGFIIKGINVQPAGSAAGVAAPPPLSAAAPGRGGLQTVLNEQLLRVTMVVEVVKLLPKK